MISKIVSDLDRKDKNLNPGFDSGFQERRCYRKGKVIHKPLKPKNRKEKRFP